MPVTEAAVLEALKAVKDPDLHRDIVSLGFVKDVRVCDGHVAFKVELTTPACPVKEQLQEEAGQVVLALEGVTTVNVEMTARVLDRKTEVEDLIPGVRQCVAVASGKGGVGKSTISVNLAIALAQQGASVGLLDADVYGPSVPLLMGCQNERPLVRDSKILPIERFGVKMMSIGFMLEEGSAVLWRGPMVAGTVRQLLSDVDWGELDYLLVDLPPGTGDAPMSLAQLVPLAGVVMVSTPHTMAATIAAKSAALFRRLDAPVLGVVENMGEYICGACGASTRLFAGMSGEDLAKQFDAPFLGSIPFDPAVGEASNAGRPAVVDFPESKLALALNSVAKNMAAQVSIAATLKTRDK